MMDAAGSQPVIALEPEFSPPIDLPPEMWEKILKKVGQKDALNLRLVNKDLMEKVNNLYKDWRIKINEKSPFLEMILNLRVKEVDVDCLLLFQPPGILFEYPDLIQKLTLSSSESSTQNAHILLQSKNLKSISLKLNSNTKPFEALPIGYNYQHLHTLEIDIETNERQTGSLFQQMMMSSMMPKLNSFKFYHDIYIIHNKDPIYNCLSVLLSFLSRQGRNLQHFHYTSRMSQRHSFAGFPPFDDSIILNNMTSLKTLKLCFKGNFDPLHNTWRSLLQNQNNLVHLNLGYQVSISSTFLRTIVANNFQTLTSVEINCWKFEEGQPDGDFDASIFQNCHNLTRLELIPNNQFNHKVVNNLFSLPTQIQTLWLGNFGAHSRDFLKFLLSHPVLCYLYICSGGNLPVIEAIVSHSGLRYVHIVRGIKVPASPSKIARLNKIFDALGCTKVEDRINFRLVRIERASVAANWEHSWH